MSGFMGPLVNAVVGAFGAGAAAQRGGRRRGRGGRGRGRGRDSSDRPDPRDRANYGYGGDDDDVIREGEAGEEEEEEEAQMFREILAQEGEDNSVQFTTYRRPQALKLHEMARHPGHVVEARSLAAVTPPSITYHLSIWEEMVETGRRDALSDLQLEAITYACQSHQTLMGDGARYAFALGDGTGVGKGRIVAGLIWENYLHGRKRSVWFTASPVLSLAIRRDISDLGLSDRIKVHEIKSFKRTQTLPGSGLLIFTYATLAMSGRSEQLLEWLGKDFDGVIAFDESHKAKNLIPASGSKDGSITGEKVWLLQESLPQARFMYCSATISTEVRHLCYMSRLGLWGPSTSFKSKEQMQKELNSGGVGVLELVGQELKQQGRYLCRTLGFEHVEFDIVRAPFPDELAQAYDQSCRLWQYLYEAVIAPASQKSAIATTFWGTHQRFFKSLFVAAKVPFIIQQAQQALAQGHCVVVGLQTTGEAQQRAENERHQEQGEEAEAGATCQAREIARSFILKHVAEWPDVQEAALAELEKIEWLPDNPLDSLVSGLGGRARVAELTGRSCQLDESNRYVSKATSKAAHEAEREAFMKGEKLVAIISEAASVGISLHADRREPNQRRRVHFVAELAWSADRALQQLGRTHRTNEIFGPIYCLVVLDKAGADLRFACSVARRLLSLGAIQHGDQKANNKQLNLKEFDVESSYGNIAVNQVLTRLGAGQLDVLSRAGLTNVGKSKAVTKFLNRLLGVPLTTQNEVVDKFFRQFEAVIREEKLNGRYNAGITDVNAESITVTEPIRVFHHAPGEPGDVGRTLRLVTLQSDRGLSWASAMAELETAEATSSHRLNGFYIYRQSGISNARVFLAIRKPDGQMELLFKKLSPDTGRENTTILFARDLQLMYRRLDEAEAQRLWEREYVRALTHCSHSTCYKRDCREGKRMRNIYVLTGDLLALWSTIRGKIGGRKRLVRVNTTTTPVRRYVGLFLVQRGVNKLKRWLPEVASEDAAGGEEEEDEEEEAELDGLNGKKPAIFDLTIGDGEDEIDESAAIRAGKRPVARGEQSRQRGVRPASSGGGVIDMTLSDDEETDDDDILLYRGTNAKSGGSSSSSGKRGSSAQVVQEEREVKRPKVASDSSDDESGVPLKGGYGDTVGEGEDDGEEEEEAMMRGGGSVSGGSMNVGATTSDDWADILDLVDDLEEEDKLTEEEATALRMVVLDKEDNIAIIYRAASRRARLEGGHLSKTMLSDRFLRNGKQLAKQLIDRAAGR